MKSTKITLLNPEPADTRYVFYSKEKQDVEYAVYQNCSLEKLLRHIHHKFQDEGLRYTLIHRLFYINADQFQYFVPQLVYIAVKKLCQPMRKALCFRSSQNQNIQRLTLWNLKAFTVLMIQRDEGIRQYVQDFQQALINASKSKETFIEAQKAIAKLTTASLQLKNFPKDKQKDELKQFITRFNYTYLQNLDHNIIIPFRGHQESSNYVVRIIQNDCDCFPTRKRVPYRIMILTVNKDNLLSQIQRDGNIKLSYDDFSKFKNDDNINKSNSSYFFKVKNDDNINKSNSSFAKQSTLPTSELFSKVTQRVNVTYGSNMTKSKLMISDMKTHSPFAIDTKQNQNNIALGILNDQIKKKQKQMELKKTKQQFGTNKHPSNQQQQQKYKIFDSIYISTIPSKQRKSISNISFDQNISKLKTAKKHKQRKSDRIKEPQDDIKKYQQGPKFQDNTLLVKLFGQSLEEKIQKYKDQSEFKNVKSLHVRNVVLKGGDDLRQEIICMQLISRIKNILDQSRSQIFIKPYEIIVLSENSGILEFVSNSVSIDCFKKKLGLTLRQYFSGAFPDTDKFTKAKLNFIRSLAGSSILTYVLSLKDRHNGNILLDRDGHIIHIDFGFILGLSPGGIGFQNSPFKLTAEYMQLIGGDRSPDYRAFKNFFYDGMVLLRKRYQDLCLILQIMMQGSDLECFQKFQIETFKEKFRLQLNNEKFKQYCFYLVDKSCENFRTVQYDKFQYYTNEIAP